MLNVKPIKLNKPDASIEYFSYDFTLFKKKFIFIVGRDEDKEKDEIGSYYAKFYDIKNDNKLIWEEYGTDIDDMFYAVISFYEEQLEYFITVSDTLNPLLWKQDSENYKKVYSEISLFRENFKFIIEYNENMALHWHMSLWHDDFDMLWQHASATMPIAMKNTELFYKKELMKLFD